MEIKIINDLNMNDEIVIKIFDNNFCAGRLVLREIVGEGHYFLDVVISEDSYNLLFPKDKYIYLSELWVDEKYRNKGIGNKLMSNVEDLMLEYFDNFDKLVLFANPFDIGDNHLELPILIKFYEKFGFKSVDSQYILPNSSYLNNLMINNF